MPKLEPIAQRLLEWYYKNRRTLPFREDPAPYHIWVSEIMLQQTRVAAALPYYYRFMEELPTIADLAACEEERLHKLWEGLGYYSRARNLQKAAKIVVDEYGGELPAEYEKLLKLPGIGEYTAGAIASIAFGLPEVAVDGNVLRVFARLLASEEDVMLPVTRKWMGTIVKQHQPPANAGDYNQAIMELGALVCLPGTPNCAECPLQGLCLGEKAGIEKGLPIKTPPKPKEELAVCLFIIKTEKGRFLLQKRPAKGLLAGLWQPLLWEEKIEEAAAVQKLSTIFKTICVGKKLPTASHVFTHKIWRMYGWYCTVLEEDIPQIEGEYTYATKQEIADTYTLPGAFKVYKKIMEK